MEKRYLVEILIVPRPGKTAGDICDLIKLDMFTLARVGTQPSVKVKEVPDDTNPKRE